ncbi:hypothetical protein Agabi119p4_4275 [Agaricus bisporus var. burnettii]|uniref:CHAT domain-containing protein n=1 Tax=Agaricus bisporus var. burnettii TaxID=192524 RepID=A0A8H7F2Z8_AGABI|nr:hypothetical protein Agabi119p4_4275 [Agaricus bisporus var. burnettii]
MEADSSSAEQATASIRNENEDIPTAESIGAIVLKRFPYFSPSMVQNVDGWILCLKFGPFRSSTIILLSSLLALRFVMRHDIPDYEEANIIKEHYSLNKCEVLNYLLDVGSRIRKDQPKNVLPLTAPIRMMSLARPTASLKGQEPSDSPSTSVLTPEDDTVHAIFRRLDECTRDFKDAAAATALRIPDFFVMLCQGSIIQSLHKVADQKQQAEFQISLGSFHYTLSQFPESHAGHLECAFDNYMTGTIHLTGLEGQSQTSKAYLKLVPFSHILYDYFNRFPPKTLSVTRKQQLCNLSELYSTSIDVSDDGTESPILLFRDTLLYLRFVRLCAIRDVDLIQQWSHGVWTNLKNWIDYRWVLAVWLKSQPERVARVKSSTNPAQLSESITYIVGDLANIEDIHTYAYACLVLGWRRYMLFQHRGDENDLGEAFDYTVTAATLMYHVDFGDEEETFTSHFFPLVITIIMSHFEYAQHHPPSVVEDERAQNFLWLQFLLRGRAKVVMYQAMEYLGPSIASRIYRSLQAVVQSYVEHNELWSDDWDSWISDIFNWRYVEYHDSNDFEIAISILEKARSRQGRASALADERLGRIYQIRYRRHENQQDFEISKDCCRAAFTKMMEYDPENAVDPVLTLAHLYMTRISIHGYNEDDLAPALLLLGKAIGMVDESDPRFAAIVIALGEAHALDTESEGRLALSVLWFQIFADLAIAGKVPIHQGTEVYISTLPEVREKLAESSMSQSFPTPGDLFLRGIGALKMNDPECLDAFDLAFSLMSQKGEVEMGIKIADKYTAAKSRHIHLFGEVAAAATLKFGRPPSRAIEYLEQTLSITYRQLLQMRTTSILGLADKYPHLARKLEDLSVDLQRSSSYRSTKTSQNEDIPFGTDNFRVTLEYRDLLNEIRRKPGFETLFLSLPYSRLAAAARDGPVIVLSGDIVTNSTRALIVLRHDTREPSLVQLPGAPPREIETQCRALKRLLGHHNKVLEKRSTQGDGGRAGGVGKRRQDTAFEGFDEVLNWIWEKIVQPVYENLSKNGIKSGRIWWCPTGSLVHLPLHAAAPLASPYISSYTYTLEALVKARTNLSMPNDLKAIRFSAVGMMTYPEHDYLALPKVETELEWLEDIARKNRSIDMRLIKDEDAQITTVLDAMSSSHLVHLACHGVQHATQPLDSHLTLNDGDLSLRRILNEDLNSAQFALLSACQTATGDEALVNESIHLAGGFMAAGFKGVIGTLWSMADDDAPMVTEEVYKAMITDGSVDITKAAEGLNRAVRRMREKNYPPYRWMPFIHVGV